MDESDLQDAVDAALDELDDDVVTIVVGSADNDTLAAFSNIETVANKLSQHRGFDADERKADASYTIDMVRGTLTVGSVKIKKPRASDKWHHVVTK